MKNKLPSKISTLTVYTVVYKYNIFNETGLLYIYICNTEVSLYTYVYIYTYVYSDTSILRTPLGSLLTVVFMEVCLFSRFYMYTCQWKGCQMGQSSGVCIWVVSFNRVFTVYYIA